MRAWYGAGKPKAAHDRGGEFTFATLQLYLVCMRISRPGAPLGRSGCSTAGGDRMGSRLQKWAI